MDFIEVMNRKEVQNLVSLDKEVKLAKQRVGYNISTISSYTYHLENFHSDIIASLLDPEGLHNEGITFLELFIDYLQNLYSVKIDSSFFLNTTVTREKGRLDIWIKDELSKKAVIIENKVNHAPDREHQLSDYYEYSTNAGFAVIAIIYLSLDGYNYAPTLNLGDTPILNIGAFTNNSTDLVNGWLEKCKQKCTNENSKSFLIQYIHLLTHLSNENMSADLEESFYNTIIDKNSIETVQLISDLALKLGGIRGNRFWRALENDIAPFKKSHLYYSGYWLFENYKDGENVFKLDVCFNNDGSAFVTLWNTEKRNDEGYRTVKSKLAETNLLNLFDGISRYSGLSKDFNMTKEMTLSKIDGEVLTFVQKVFKNLREI